MEVETTQSEKLAQAVERIKALGKLRGLILAPGEEQTILNVLVYSTPEGLPVYKQVPNAVYKEILKYI